MKEQDGGRASSRRETGRERTQRRRLMTAEERVLDHRAEKRAQRSAIVGDKDLVAMALADPGSFKHPLRSALLDAPLWPEDETKLARQLPGCKLTPAQRFDLCAATHDLTPAALSSPAACKFMICDMRVSPFDPGDPVARIEVAYQEQLRLEREDDDLERARELVRTPEMRLARRNARAILREFEMAAERGEDEPDAQAIWARIGPQAPEWVRDIDESGEDYGFAILTSREARARPQAARDQWMTVFNEAYRGDNLGGFKANPRVHGGSRLVPYMVPYWVGLDDHEDMPSEEDHATMRDMFKNKVRPRLPTPRYPRDTFLVFSDDCLFPELDTVDLDIHDEKEGWESRPESRDMPTFFLWAYDAEWAPPKGAGADQDGYQGRVKVAVRTLLVWFYFATLTGVDMKAMWRRSLELTDGVWTCENDMFNPGEPKQLT
ncbi:hypothetical protein F5X68DRAFT_276501 [Plectosphaerella plurivora]|uniref:Uncharacterized protein n=1 Tax=Plectosphaerella plurivora TaxID=936078 RepID=A0A9P9A9C0_9PEZI|nr:hypothetical protein F5X68DRAFT_276501 [Plectosphaerella plurivora]